MRALVDGQLDPHAPADEPGATPAERVEAPEPLQQAHLAENSLQQIPELLLMRFKVFNSMFIRLFHWA